MGAYFLFAALVAGCALLWWFAYKLEPHWVSKDGQRVVCYGQPIDKMGESQGRWRELRVAKVSNDTVEVRVRRGSLVVDKYSGGSTGMMGLGGVAGDVVRRRGKRPSYWRVVGQTPNAPRRRVVYLLNACTDPTLPAMLAVRLPVNSRAIPMLESLAVNPREGGSSSLSQPSRGTPQSEATPDPD